jgi:hypothetical protein
MQTKQEKGINAEGAEFAEKRMVRKQAEGCATGAESSL